MGGGVGGSGGGGPGSKEPCLGVWGWGSEVRVWG